jgi:hypothetical protein
MSHQSEKSPYENVLVGGFILALGHRLGTAGKRADAFSANLLQQTPMDPIFGDLMAENELRGFLLEFKRDWDGRLTEREKEKFNIIGNNIQLLHGASRCHLLGYGQPLKRHFNLKFGPYVEIVNAQEEDKVREVWCLPEFLERVVHHKIGGSSEDFRAYLNGLFRAFTKYFDKETGWAAGAEKIRVAKRKCRKLFSTVSGAAIMYAGERFYTVPFSSIMQIGIMLSIKQAIDLDQRIETDDFGYGIRM